MLRRCTNLQYQEGQNGFRHAQVGPDHVVHLTASRLIYLPDRLIRVCGLGAGYRTSGQIQLAGAALLYSPSLCLNPCIGELVVLFGLEKQDSLYEASAHGKLQKLLPFGSQSRYKRSGFACRAKLRAAIVSGPKFCLAPYSCGHGEARPFSQLTALCLDSCAADCLNF